MEELITACKRNSFHNSEGHIARLREKNNVEVRVRVGSRLTKLRATSTPHKEQGTGLLSHSLAS